MARVQDIASAPLPSPVPASDRHFGAALRMMLAVLPRQQTDDLGGELFVEAYQRHLGHYPDAGINYLTDRAIARCRWFPTVAECLEIMADWRRDDEHTRRKSAALAAARRETNERENDRRTFTWRKEPITQADVDKMPDYLRNVGIACGALERDENGNVRPVPPFVF